MMKLTVSDRVFNLVNGILMLLLVVLTLYPFTTSSWHPSAIRIVCLRTKACCLNRSASA